MRTVAQRQSHASVPSILTKSSMITPVVNRHVPAIVHEVLHTPGHPLDSDSRAFMEPRFAHDFSKIRVHSDAQAAESALAVNALAYTAGRHIVFGAGQYSPMTTSGRQLLGHELAHTIQQGSARDCRPVAVGDSYGRLEREADEATRDVNRTAGTLPNGRDALVQSSAMRTTLLQRADAAVSVPELNLPYSEEETSMEFSYAAHETVPPDCRRNSLVLSWESDTCCSNRGFLDPATRNRKTGAPCCNVFPKFVDVAATQRGFDGAASCKPKYKGHSATITPKNAPNAAVKVICTDTRSDSLDVIELSQTAALKAYGNARLRERGATVCYGFHQEPGTCYLETDCRKTKYPKEQQCLPADCSKTKPTASPLGETL